MITLFNLTVLLFVVGVLFLFFGRYSDPMTDIIGFLCIIVSFIIMSLNAYSFLNLMV